MSEASEVEKGDKGDNDVYEVDDWKNMIVNRDDMMRACTGI